jgi:hypothetical protein
VSPLWHLQLVWQFPSEREDNFTPLRSSRIVDVGACDSLAKTVTSIESVLTTAPLIQATLLAALENDSYPYVSPVVSLVESMTYFQRDTL